MPTTPSSDSPIHAPSLPDEAVEALRAILGGAAGDAVEGQHLDLKEDPARSRRPAGNPDAKRVELVLDSAICFANADGPAHLILGVADKTSGPDAFTGTEADVDQLRGRVFNRTRPNLTVEVHEVFVGDVRLLDVAVPQGLSVYSRTDGAASRRDGSRCVPLSDLERSTISFERANPDVTARPSAVRISDLDPDALATARRFLGERSVDSPPGSDEDVLRRMGVLTPEGTVLEAGAILLGRAHEHRVIARHLWRRTPSGEPSATEYTLPVLTAMAQMRERVEALSDPEAARVDLPTGRETPIPNFPARAIDEVVSNAFIHRDWSSSMPIVIDQSPISLSVSSPGGLPTGVRDDRLLTTRSTPRNGALMRALHTLGLAEETSRGFDRMWVSMLQSGRTAPAIEADDFHVDVTFTAGIVDAEYVRWISALGTVGFSPEDVRSLNCQIALKHLKDAPTISQHMASQLMQTRPEEAAAQLAWLVSLGLLEEARSPREWQLSTRARSVLDAAGGSAPLAGAIEEWILHAVGEGRTITNQQVVRATDANSRDVTQALRYLSNTRRIEKAPDSPERGSKVRWRRKS